MGIMVLDPSTISLLVGKRTHSEFIKLLSLQLIRVQFHVNQHEFSLLAGAEDVFILQLICYQYLLNQLVFCVSQFICHKSTTSTVNTFCDKIKAYSDLEDTSQDHYQISSGVCTYSLRVLN